MIIIYLCECINFSIFFLEFNNFGRRRLNSKDKEEFNYVINIFNLIGINRFLYFIRRE